MVEHSTHNPLIVGSNPNYGIDREKMLNFIFAFLYYLVIVLPWQPYLDIIRTFLSDIFMKKFTKKFALKGFLIKCKIEDKLIRSYEMRA